MFIEDGEAVISVVDVSSCAGLLNIALWGKDLEVAPTGRIHELHMGEVPATLGSPASIDEVSSRWDQPLLTASSPYTVSLTLDFVPVRREQNSLRLQDPVLYHFALSRVVCLLV